MKARTPLHCLDKDRKDIPNFQIFFRLSSAGRDLRAVRRLRACEGRRRSRRPAPPDALRLTVGRRRTGERVEPHRRATGEGKRPSARGGGQPPQKRPPHRKAPSDAEARGSEKMARTRKRRTAAPHEVRAPAVRGAKGQRGEEVKRRRGEEAKRRRGEGSKEQRVEKKPLPPRFAARPQAIIFFAIR